MAQARESRTKPVESPGRGERNTGGAHIANTAIYAAPASPFGGST